VTQTKGEMCFLMHQSFISKGKEGGTTKGGGSSSRIFTALAPDISAEGGRDSRFLIFFRK